jgi:acyl carrier protein
MSEIENALQAILEEAIPGIEFDPTKDGDRPLKELGIDSLDKMSILLAVQEKWNREFSEAEINDLNTVNDICRKVA